MFGGKGSRYGGGGPEVLVSSPVELKGRRERNGQMYEVQET